MATQIATLVRSDSAGGCGGRGVVDCRSTEGVGVALAARGEGDARRGQGAGRSESPAEEGSPCGAFEVGEVHRRSTLLWSAGNVLGVSAEIAGSVVV
jgi:hypothetical protein